MTCSSAPRALMPLALARQHERHDEIDDEPRQRPRSSRSARRPAPARAVAATASTAIQTIRREHRERVDERGEHFGARIAVGRTLATAAARSTAAAMSATTNDAASVTMWPASEISASEPANTPASRLDRGKAAGQDERDPQRAPRRARLRVGMVVRVRMRVMIRRVVRLHMATAIGGRTVIVGRAARAGKSLAWRSVPPAIGGAAGSSRRRIGD